MRYFFDDKLKVTAQIVEIDVAFDCVNEVVYPISENYKQEHMIEITQSSCEYLTSRLKQWFFPSTPYDLSQPLLNEINSELIKYGI
jgi:hypothetical protein